MKIKKTGIILPGREELASFFIIGTRAEAEMLLQIVPATDVVAGENVETTQSAKQGVFGGPAADAANGEKFFEGGGVVEFGERFEVDFTGGDGATEFENGALFILAVAESAERAGGKGSELGGRRAGMSGVGFSRRRCAEIFHEPIQQHDADVQRDLLAGNGVEERFENRRIAGRLETGEFGDEYAELFVFSGERVEVAEIGAEAEHAVESRANGRLDSGDFVRRFQGDA